MPETALSSQDKIYQDVLDGNLPKPVELCIPCTLPGAMFSLEGNEGCDFLLGIPRQGVGPAWFRDNPWIRDTARNHRDTFLQQVLEQAGSTYGDAWLAEFHAFAAREKLQLVCVDEQMRLDDLAPPVLDHMGVRTHQGMGFELHSNFFFADHSIYFATFTHARWSEAPREEYLDDQGERHISPPYTWHSPSGLYPVDQACTQLAAHFAEARGKQVFMAINLALLLPNALGGARWLMHKLRPGSVTTVRLDNAALTEEQVRRLGRREAGEVSVLETSIDRPARDGGLAVRASELHAIDRNASRIALEVVGGRADYAYMATTMRDRLVALISHAVGPVRMGGGLTRVVADAGEEALAAALVSHWKVKPENILGMSTHPSRASQFGLKNKSDQGIDMLVYVPPPPSMSVRNPTNPQMRHHIDGIKGVAPLEELQFAEGTLLVIEVKTTLGRTKTPGFLKTQAVGGKENVKRIQKLILNQKQGWSVAQLSQSNPNFEYTARALRAAARDNKISYIHAQVFFDPNGKISTLPGLALGIQLNNWR
ncbi:hypothetical protein [Pseudomonas mosselii]